MLCAWCSARNASESFECHWCGGPLPRRRVLVIGDRGEVPEGVVVGALEAWVAPGGILSVLDIPGLDMYGTSWADANGRLAKTCGLGQVRDVLRGVDLVLAHSGQSGVCRSVVQWARDARVKVVTV